MQSTIFFRRNEIPTLDKICKAVNTDGTLGTFKRSSLHKLLRSIGFKFSKRSRNSMLTERDDIFFGEETIYARYVMQDCQET